MLSWKNFVLSFPTNKNDRIPLFLLPDVVNLYKVRLTIWNTKCLRYWVAKIKGLENQSLWVEHILFREFPLKSFYTFHYKGSLQGYPQRMRLYRRLYGIYIYTTGCLPATIFSILNYCKKPLKDCIYYVMFFLDQICTSKKNK